MKIHGVATLGAAQALALAAGLGSAAAYAAWLDAAELAAWAIALGAGRAALLLVDGGLKTSLVRHAQDLTPAAGRRLTRCVCWAALVLSVVLLLPLGHLADHGAVERTAATLSAASVLAYLLAHAVSLMPLVRLERAGRFDHVGRAEGLATLLEFVLPALLMALGVAAVPALIGGLVLGRLSRATLLAMWARAIEPTASSSLAAPPWRDALAMQFIAACSMLRDQVHLWLVGPLYGVAWAGAYAFALMACALASQVAVATVARVAVPALRPLGPRRRALRAARTLRRLSLVTLPILALTWPVLQWANTHGWQGQWTLALSLLPGLLLRMALALPLSVLGAWLTVAVAPREAAAVHARWTLLEVALAAGAIAAMGPSGLAWSWAVGGALGTGLFLWALRAHGVGMMLAALWRRPAPGARRWSTSTSS